MWTGVLLLTILPHLVASTCHVTCKKNTPAIVKDNQCICSRGYPGKYAKGDNCALRLSLHKDRRIRLEVEKLKMRYGAECTTDRLIFENMFNAKKRPYWMDTYCKSDQLHGTPKSMIINTSQARMKFGADKKGGSTAGKRWKVCLKSRVNPEIKDASCTDMLTNFIMGYNRRQIPLTNTNTTTVTKVCCKTEGFYKTDQVFLSCVDSSKEESPSIPLTSTEKCVNCNYLKTAAHVEVDQPFVSANKKITCTCSSSLGASIGESCVGDIPCLDTKDLAFCDPTTNICKCPTGYVTSTDGNYCTTESDIGESCADGENCVSKYSQAYCNGTTCVCPDGYWAADSNTRCTQDVAIGADCSLERGCIDSLNRATCVNDVCTCSEGSPSTDNTHCSLKNGYKGACIDVKDCTVTRSKKCSSGQCACESPFVDYKGQCSYKSNLNGICQYTATDCVVTNSKCTGGLCKCKSVQYKASGTTACNAVCVMKDSGSTQVNKGKFICNKRYKSGKCYYCECKNPPKTSSRNGFTVRNTKSSCGNISGCSKPGVKKFSVFKGTNCGE